MEMDQHGLLSTQRMFIATMLMGAQMPSLIRELSHDINLSHGRIRAQSPVGSVVQASSWHIEVDEEDKSKNAEKDAGEQNEDDDPGMFLIFPCR